MTWRGENQLTNVPFRRVARLLCSEARTFWENGVIQHRDEGTGLDRTRRRAIELWGPFWFM